MLAAVVRVVVAAACLVGWGLAPGAAMAAQSLAKPVAAVTGAAIQVDDDRTTVQVELTSGVGAEVFTLASPYRVVVELPSVELRLAAQAPFAPAGVVQAISFEALSDEGARVVLATRGPVEVVGADLATVPANGAGGPARLTLTLRGIDAVRFGGGTGADLPPERQRTGEAIRPGLYDDGAAAQARANAALRARPVVMIDAGHGGIDPGALGPHRVAEKTIVLAVAHALRQALEATGRYDVRMTRTGDVFIPLDKRVEMSRNARADLFISLHADSIENHSAAQTLRGASLYILSDKASTEEARLMADKENAADRAAGLEPPAPETEGVRPILFDLMARETAMLSRLTSQCLHGALAKARHPLAPDPERAAAFRVLRQTEAPAVLIEIGFLSNPEEVHQMGQADWQSRLATAIASGVELYFERKAELPPVPLAAALGGLRP